MWSTVGLVMGFTGACWLVGEGLLGAAIFELTGLLLAVGVVRWRFGDMAKKNIRRLRRLPDRGCFFAFQAWQSYLIILFMVGLGFALRNSPIPKNILSVIYTAIGGALFLGSFHYHRHLVRLMRTAAVRRAARRSG